MSQRDYFKFLWNKIIMTEEKNNREEKGICYRPYFHESRGKPKKPAGSNTSDALVGNNQPKPQNKPVEKS